MPRVGWHPNLMLGAGFDTLAGEAKSVGVRGIPAVDEKAGGEEGETAYLLINNSEEFDQALDINAELSVGAGPFGASAKFGFRERSKVSNQATFCMIRISVTHAYEALREPKLVEDAWTLVANKNQDRFRQRFGDRFVSGRWTGIEFYGSIRIEAEHIERQKEIAAEIAGSYGMAVSGKGSIAHSNNEKSDKHTIEALVFQKGGEVALVESLDELVGLGKKALEDARNGKAYPFAFELDPYEELNLPNDDANFINVAYARTQMSQLGAHRIAMERMQNDVEFVLKNQGWFVNPDIIELNAINAKLTEQLRIIKEHAEVCSVDFKKCEPYAPVYPELNIPPRKAGLPAPPPQPSTIQRHDNKAMNKIIASLRIEPGA